MPVSQWTPEEIEMLRAGLARGGSISALANKLGKTRGVVHAYVQRRRARGEPGWEAPPVAAVETVVVETAVAPEPPPVELVAEPGPIMVPVQSGSRAPVPVHEPACAPPGAVGLMERTGCCWPVFGGGASTLFCNADRPAGDTYCTHHTHASLSAAMRDRPRGKPKQFLLQNLMRR